MNNKKEGEYYYQMVRKYKDEYGGKNLKDGDISLAGTIHDKVVEGIREEVRKEMRKEYQAIIDEKDAKIAYYESRDSHREVYKGIDIEKS